MSGGSPTNVGSGGPGGNGYSFIDTGTGDAGANSGNGGVYGDGGDAGTGGTGTPGPDGPNGDGRTLDGDRRQRRRQPGGTERHRHSRQPGQPRLRPAAAHRRTRALRASRRNIAVAQFPEINSRNPAGPPWIKGTSRSEPDPRWSNRRRPVCMRVRMDIGHQVLCEQPRLP